MPVARLLGELQEKTRAAAAARGGGMGGGAAAAAANTPREVDGSEVNNLFFEWQQARDVEMLNRLGLGLMLLATSYILPIMKMLFCSLRDLLNPSALYTVNTHKHTHTSYNAGSKLHSFTWRAICGRPSAGAVRRRGKKAPECQCHFG